MFSRPNKTIAAQLLRESRLLLGVLPKQWKTDVSNESWSQRFNELDKVSSGSFESAIAILLMSFLTAENQTAPLSQLQSAWRLTNQQRDSIGWIVNNWEVLAEADQRRWSEIQPRLIHTNATDALDVGQCSFRENRWDRILSGSGCSGPPERLNPTPLLVGKNLIDIGLNPGPTFKFVTANCPQQTARWRTPFL